MLIGNMARPPADTLSPLESRVMDIVWRRQTASAEDVARELGQALSNASVRTILRRVEAKGFISHTMDGRTFIYSPKVDPGTVARGLVRRLVDRFYGGSVEQLVIGLVDGKMIDRRKLDKLARQVEAAKASPRRHRGDRG